MNGTNANTNDARENPALLPLTPGLLSLEELRAYDNEFNLVFRRDDLRNIALTGATGSGKTTVMNSWMMAHPNHGWLSVSLANFATGAQRPSEAAIEEALINQIVGQMDLRRAPHSSFSRKVERPWYLDLAFGIFVALFIALTILLISIYSQIPSARPPMPIVVIATIAWFACIVFGVYRIVRTDVIGSIIKRFRKQPEEPEEGEAAAEAEQPEQPEPEETMPLQRAMTDLVYLLNVSDYDTVVFDDLDSFEYLALFQQLRQLNELANVRRGPDQDPLRFFYLVNDALFTDPHDRAKFFDYIITVIPYIDPSNSLSLVREWFEGIGVHADENFLYELSLFIDDPRILRDLVNEVHHYQTVLFADAPMKEGDTERLIALLAYKTLFPRDFELLQVDQGYVNAVLRSRPVLVEQLTADSAREAKALAKELRSGLSLRDADTLQTRIDEIERETLEINRKTLSQLLGSLKDSDAVFIRPPYTQGLEPDYLAETLASPHFPMIQFLIMRGWIDETHERFMSNFYSDSVSVRDREFLMSVFQGKALDPTYVVENPSAVVARFDADTLSWSNAKNFTLLKHLLKYGPGEKTDAVFAGLRHDDNLEWLVAFTESNEFTPSVYAEMESQLDSPVARILADDSIDVVRRRNFSHRLLAYAREVLSDEELCQALVDFAHSDLGFLKVSNSVCVEPLEIAPGLLTIGYKPEDIDASGVSKKLLQCVFENDMFQPTAPFLDNLTAALLDAKPALDSGYLVTRIYNMGDTPIKAVVEANPNIFVKTLLQNTERNLTESGDAIAWLLNIDGLSDEMAKAYISAIGQSTQIEDVRTIANPSYQAALLDQGRVSVTSENILDYFRSAGFVVDEHLGNLIDSNPFPLELSMGFVEEYLGEESGFLTAVIQCPYISNKKLGEVVTAYRAQFNHFGVEGLDDDRIELLIMRGVVRTTADNLHFVRQSNPHCARFFAAADPGSYLRLVLGEPLEEAEVDAGDEPADAAAGVAGVRRAEPECPFIEGEVLEIFALPEVDDVTKLVLLANIDGSVRMQMHYPHALNAAIAKDHFDSEDIYVISSLYMEGDRKLKRALAEAFVEQQLNFPAEVMQLSMDMVADIAWRMRDGRQSMISFIAGQLRGRTPEPSRLEVRSVFERANMREYVELMDGPSAVILDTPEDDELLEVLGELGMAGKQTGKTDWQGQRRVNSKGYTRK